VAIRRSGVGGHGAKGMMRISVKVPQEDTREMLIYEQLKYQRDVNQ